MDRCFERDTELNLAVWSRALARQLGRSPVEEFTGTAVPPGDDPWELLCAAAGAQAPRRGLLRAMAPDRYAEPTAARERAPGRDPRAPGGS